MSPAKLGLLTLALWTSLGYAAPTPDISILPTGFKGILLSTDGATPLKGVAVRVWDTQTDKVVFKTQTDQNGKFAVPELAVGDYYLTASSVRIDVRLLTGRAGITPQPLGIVIVVPSRSAP